MCENTQKKLKSHNKPQTTYDKMDDKNASFCDSYLINQEKYVCESPKSKVWAKFYVFMTQYV